jgi:hypothetical protein
MSVYEKIVADAYRTKRVYVSHWQDPEGFKAYQGDIARLEAEFRADLLVEYGVTGNPKADKCYSIAWEHEHSAGFTEVANYFGELVELIR